jgi:hypothetical protein
MFKFLRNLRKGASDRSKPGAELGYSERVKRQSEALASSGFKPISEERLERSDAAYTSTSWRSTAISDYARHHQHLIHPIRALHETGIELVLQYCRQQGWPQRSTSEVVADLSEYHLRSLDAAIADTPIDLIAAFERALLPNVREWSNEAEFLDGLMEQASASGASRISTLAARLLHDRIVASNAADFLAFKEAFCVLQDIGVFHRPDASIDSMEISPILLDIFPVLRKNEMPLRERARALFKEEAGCDVVR